MQPRTIDFLIIGATKSGTTWLQRSLQQASTVYMPGPELHFFSRNYHLGVPWYREQFSGRTERHRHVGEKSNSYLTSEQAASRIQAFAPDVKLIAQLRNPVDRAYSDYCMLLRRGEVGTDIGSHLDPRLSGANRFLSGGKYVSQLQAYFDSFPASQIKIVMYDGILNDSARHLGAVAEFLGLESGAVRPVVDKVKDKSTAILNPSLRRCLGFLKPAVQPIRDTWLYGRVRGLIARQPVYPPLTSDLRGRLIDFYARDVERLGSHVGCDLLPWLHGAPLQDRAAPR